MQFYKAEGTITDEEFIENNNDMRSRRNLARKILSRTDDFNDGLQEKIFFFVSEVCEDVVSIGIISDDPVSPRAYLDLFIKTTELEAEDLFVKEITFTTMEKMLGTAERNDYIYSDGNILEQFELDQLHNRYIGCMEYEEKVLDEAGKNTVYKETERILAGDSLMPELDRIYSGRKNKSAAGHPVHYIIQSDDETVQSSIYRLLMQALYANERIYSRRFTFVNISHDERFSRKFYDCLYKINKGGTVIVRFHSSAGEEADHANADRDLIEKICEAAKKYRIDVLTVFCMDRECTKIKDIFYENLDNMSFVEIKEDFVKSERAKKYLKMLAGKNDIRSDKKLFEKLRENDEYLTSDLISMFNSWYDGKLKTVIYPQYSKVTTVKNEIIKQEPKGSAYDELKRMTGLTEAKKVINQALDYYKAQKIFAQKGMKKEKASMHMVFTGNPGTAKTTVARLFARIMKENGLLSKGNLIEVGRGDLVGKYIGWTAKIVQKRFKDAMGSVLFIDEAYSLVDDRDGSFGDEAINTIVQEMENHRNDVVVIFAGYPDKMEGFLNKNPGLRSRIAFHVPFEDYSSDDLCEIARFIADGRGLTIADEAYEKMARIFEDARKKSDFGNGRYVRNMLEKARMTQSSRLLRMDFDDVKKDDIMTILAEDIEALEMKEAASRNFGFSA